MVETAPLTALVSHWVRRWDAQHPSTVGQFHADGRCEVSCIGGVSWLVQETGLSRRTIQRIVAGTRMTTELHHADLLLNAIGAEHMRHVLEVRGNPRASRVEREQCCGGSLNGAAEEQD